MPPMRTSGATADPAFRAQMLKAVPLGRSGEADEVANAVVSNRKSVDDAAVFVGFDG